jgi:hypothetical protein
MGNREAVSAKVYDILAANFDAELHDRGGYTLRQDSVQMFVYVNQWSKQPDGPVTIKFSCPILFDLQPSPELFEHLAVHADDYLFGHLSAFSSDAGAVTIFFTHNILGDFLDEEELTSTIRLMLGTADQLDDELKEQFGGERFHDD